MKQAVKIRSLNEVVAGLPKGERRRIAVRAHELIAEEMSLRELRQALAKTQTAVARRLGIGQEAVSKLEMRADMHVSTLSGMLKAMGGELELIARFPDRPPARLRLRGSTAARRPRDRTVQSRA